LDAAIDRAFKLGELCVCTDALMGLAQENNWANLAVIYHRSQKKVEVLDLSTLIIDSYEGNGRLSVKYDPLFSNIHQ